ncbi:chemotaxis protein CheA [Sorangium sp. So ce1153]|uniref:chemotaxis protein CheA n=1 Tax=Sorangium sp. So ce1153 TaxID=3133333 RepID=UPI003F5DA073
MDVDTEAVLQVFLAETEDSFIDLEESIIRLETHADDSETLGRLFRRVHSLKGNAASLGFAKIAEFAHAVENVLEGLRGRTLAVTGELVTLLLQCVDVLRGMISAAATGIDELPVEGVALLHRLVLELGHHPGKLGVEPASQHVAPPPERLKGRAQTLRVDVEKLDRMLSLMGEMTIARSRVSRMLESPEELQRADLAQSHEEADRLFLELQSVIIEARMVPIGDTFRGYLRAVRDLAAEHGKLARLTIEGEDVELDTRVVEHIREPLTHMIGNALDHGIERPAERVSRGKPPCGNIVLRARHESGTVVIEISDDGAGMDRAKILERARAQGLMDESSQPSDADLYQLIFQPGFSTAASVTSHSGRGVGMDVVRRNLEAIRGSVSVRSRDHEGCTIVLCVPLTLAIIAGFTVAVGGEMYVLPLEAVEECADLPEGEQRRGACRGLLRLHDRPLPYVRLRSLFNVEAAPPRRESVVVVRLDGEPVGLVVDELHGRAQTVIKPLGPLLQGLPGMSGSTILGDGTVALILDVAGVCRLALRDGSAPSAARLAGGSSLEERRRW